MASYLTADELRALLGLQVAEWTDATLTLYIDMATKEIDARTGRTWQGEQYAQEELYDGNGLTKLRLHHGDLQRFSSLSIATSASSSYTGVTWDYGNNAGSKFNWYPWGLIELNTAAGPEVATFSTGTKTVKVSYVYGNTSATNEVKLLCAQLISNYIKYDDMRQKRIDSLFDLLKLPYIYD